MTESATAAVAFANKGTISVGGTDIGVVKDIEVTISAEHVNLYGWGSILRQAVAKHSAKVSVKIGYMRFDPATTTGWQFSAWCTAGALNDTNTVTTFTVVAVFKFEAGSGGTPVAQTLTGTILNVYFPNFPLKMAEGQWMKVDMVGEGSTITFATT